MDDIEKLKHLLGKLDSSALDSSQPAPTQGMCSLTLSDTLPSLGLNASNDEFRNAWILDSSATDHMTNFSLIHPVQATGKLLSLMVLHPWFQG